MKLLVLLVLFSTAAEACLRPKFAFPRKYFACTKDSDCVIYQDACRTCENPWAVNKTHLRDLQTADTRLRGQDKCQKTCKACDTSKLRTFCRLDACQAGPAL